MQLQYTRHSNPTDVLCVCVYSVSVWWWSVYICVCGRVEVCGSVWSVSASTGEREENVNVCTSSESVSSTVTHAGVCAKVHTCGQSDAAAKRGEG